MAVFSHSQGKWSETVLQVYIRLISAALLSVLLPSTLASAEVLDCLIQPHRVVKMGSSTTGILRDIPVKRGDTVEKGQLLARLEDDLERISVELSRTRIKFLQSRVDRFYTLKQQSMTSDEALEQAEIELEVEKSELERWKTLLQQKSILSLFKGVVIDLLLAEGENVHEQSPIMVVASIDPLYVELLVPMSMYRDIDTGMQAEVTLDDPIGGTYIANVIVTDKVIDAASATFGVRLNLPNPGLDIPAGVNCQARFLTDRRS